WVEDPDFDLDQHVHRVVVPAPGGQREFCELISDIASRQLARPRPLWEIWVAEALERGRVGFVAKIHHSVADGVAAADLLANVLTPDAEVHEPPPPAEPWVPDAVPTRVELLLGALAGILAGLRSLPALIKRTMIGIRDVRRVRRRHPDTSPPFP